MDRTDKKVLSAVELLTSEMGIRFGEVDQRLEHMDSTLRLHAKHLAAGTRAIAGFVEWVGKADADYMHGAFGSRGPEARVGKLEAGGAPPPP